MSDSATGGGVAGPHGDGTVVVGPWPGSTARPAARLARLRRGIPRRYRADRWGTTVLMDCRACRTPFAPDVEIPRDRLCAGCRQTADTDTPALFPIEEGPR